jgi:raffinose synthase
MSPAPHPLAAVFITLPDNIETIATPEGGYLLRFTPLEPSPRCLYRLGALQAIRLAAAHRYEPFWMKPAVCKQVQDVPVETQVLFLELPGDRIALLVPLAGGKHNAWRCSLEGSPEGLVLVAETGGPAPYPTASFTALYVATAARDELHECTRRAAATVARALDTTTRADKRLPLFIDHFGWCTWDAFYQDVSHEKVRQGLESFRAIGIQPLFLILDDGWQSEQSFGEERGRRLTSLLPNEKFGHDLRPTTRMAREEFGITTFLVWHAFQGYWGGVGTPGDLAGHSTPVHAKTLGLEFNVRIDVAAYRSEEVPRSYAAGILHYLPEFNTRWWGATAGIIPSTNIQGFFENYHRTLKAQGVDGVKVDNQAALEAFADLESTGRTALYRAYHDALEISVAEHFSSQQPLLNCMSCVNDLLYSYQQSALTRTSADFYPQHPHLHGTHLWTNAFVATWFAEFIHPDWDMFQSLHPFASFHAAARALSGGPIYVSDKPGHHDPDLLRKLVLSDGTVLRPDRPATLTSDALFTDPTREDAPLKAWTTTRDGQTGILGLFNCRHVPDQHLVIRAAACPADVPALAEAQRYAVYAHRAGKLRLLAHHENLSFDLAQGEWELLTVVPVIDGAAVLGLIDLLLGSAAVLAATRGKESLELSIREGGILGVHCADAPVSVQIDGVPASWEQKGSLITVPLPRGSAHHVVLRWAEMPTSSPAC